MVWKTGRPGTPSRGWIAGEGQDRMDAMKAVIHIFSGTGNTARAVKILAARLAAAGHEVAVVGIDGNTVPAGEIPDLTVMAFPIWAWAAPHFVLDYARRLPRARGAHAAVLATCGGFGAQGIGEMERVLRRRGYVVVASGEAVYPDNWVLAVNPKTGTEREKTLEKGDEQIGAFAESLLSEHPATFPCAWGHLLWSWPIARLFRWAGRRFMGKFFIADGQCTSCGVCAAACPVRAIRMDGTPTRPRWGMNCAGCFRCINLCPAQAIQVSVARLAIHLGLNLGLTVGWFFWVGGLYRQVAPLPGAMGWGLAALWALAILFVLTGVQLTVVDAGIEWLARRPALRRIFGWNYTKSFGRYRAPGFHPGPTVAPDALSR